jgi:hypothetical protein
MKPANWGQMSDKERARHAHALMSSQRGDLLMGQALAWAVRTMKAEKFPETSNIQDMEAIGEVLFEPWFSTFQGKFPK